VHLTDSRPREAVLCRFLVAERRSTDAMPIIARLASLCLLAAPTFAQQWQLQPSLPARTSAGLTFDLARGETVVFGGTRDGTYLADTWAFDGTSWRQRVTPTSPPARLLPALAFDSGRNRVVLFGGGIANSTLAGDTWEYDGSTWSQVSTPNAPSPRSTSLAFDSQRSRIVLFGGTTGTAIASNETWLYDGSDWTQSMTPNAPSTNAEPSLAFDSARGRTVLLQNAPNVATWEFDGTAWHAIATATTPPYRIRHALAYDSVRQRTVCYGGSGPGIPTTPNLVDTWEYDGVDWTLRTPVHMPGPQWPEMTYDPVRQSTVLLGGNGHPQSTLWTYDGTDWTDHSGPSVRTYPGLAHDARRDRTILFGGSNSGPLRDTWEHDGTTWRRNANADGPLYLESMAMVHDVHRDRTVLFGGAFLWLAYDQTWEYDGTLWTVRNLPAHPPARMGHQMAYDAGRRRTVLFGGSPDSGNNVLTDTWEYDGTTWQPITPASILPAGRLRGAMVYDAARMKVLLFGGTNNPNLPGFSDTWYWDGSAWVQQAPLHRPSARHAHGLAYDLRRGRAVLFGGRRNSITLLDDTWEYDGSDWIQVAGNPANGPRATPLVYRVTSGTVLGFGGRNANDQPTDGTIEFTPPAGATAASLGRGCPGSAGVPHLLGVGHAVPSLGTTFPLLLQNVRAAPGFALLAFGFGLSHWNGNALPYDLAAVGLPGCDLWIGPLDGLSVLLGTAGSGTFGLALPADPAFGGTVLAVQGLSFDLGAPSGLGATSNAIVLRIQ
jgi:hypothetical protein